MENLNSHDVFAIVSGLANAAMIFVTMKIKVEITELKLWIHENFERRKV